MSTPSAKTTSAGAKAAKKTVEKAAKKSSTEKKVIRSHSNRKLGSSGLMRFSRGRMFQRRALYRIGKWKDEQAKANADKTKKTTGSIQKKAKKPALQKKAIGGDRNGKERLVRTKRFVSALIKSEPILIYNSFGLCLQFSLVIIQLRNDPRNSAQNASDLAIIHADFDHH